MSGTTRAWPIKIGETAVPEHYLSDFAAKMRRCSECGEPAVPSSGYWRCPEHGSRPVELVPVADISEARIAWKQAVRLEDARNRKAAA